MVAVESVAMVVNPHVCTTTRISLRGLSALALQDSWSISAHLNARWARTARCGRRCCRRRAIPMPSRIHWPDGRTVRWSELGCDRGASRSSEGSRRGPGRGTQSCVVNHGFARRRGPRGRGCGARDVGDRSDGRPASWPTITHGLSSGRGRAERTLAAAPESGTIRAPDLPSRSLISAASRFTSSQCSVWISPSRQPVSMSRRIAVTAASVSEPSAAISFRTGRGGGTPRRSGTAPASPPCTSVRSGRGFRRPSADPRPPRG